MKTLSEGVKERDEQVKTVAWDNRQCQPRVKRVSSLAMLVDHSSLRLEFICLSTEEKYDSLIAEI